jgi:hypothetical protein
VQYAVACHAITVTNYRFTWCIIVINVMFNTVKPLAIVFERSMKNKQWMREKIDLGQLIILNYLGRIVWKLSLQGRFFVRIMNYKGFWNNQVNLFEFFLLGTYIWIATKYWITERWFNQVLLYCYCRYYRLMVVKISKITQDNNEGTFLVIKEF